MIENPLHDPMNAQKVTETIGQITHGGAELAASMGSTINRVSILRAMTAGYRMCLENNGLPVPDSLNTDPGADLIKSLT